MDAYQDILKTRASKGVRLNKYLADLGLASRRQADAWIEAGRVEVNHVVAQAGVRVQPGDQVSLDGRLVSVPDQEQLPFPPVGKRIPDHRDAQGKQLVYIALNKPKGIVCTTDRRERNNVIDFLDFPLRLFPIGRLDKASTGLLLVTNDGDLVNRILRAKHHHEKEYEVEVDRPLAPGILDQMSRGVPILDTVTLPCRIESISPTRFRIILTQGLNRQIRRMTEYFGYQVTRLNRVRILNISLGNLKPGQWRYLTPAELGQLEELLDRA